MTISNPRLSHDLRLALSVLYSLPTAADYPSPKPQAREAHDYLLQFQSRNVRRKLSSKAKSQNQKQEEGKTEDILQSLEPCDFGSSWLACLGLLSTHKMTRDRQHQVNYAEALFAAQTMVHRLRRVTLSEAIDLEFESPNALPPSAQQIIESYMKWSESFSGVLCQVLKSYQPHSDDEECVKGEITVLSLTTILYCMTSTSYHELSSMRPLLATMASALAVTAARLRYTSKAIPSPAQNTQPIVKMIIHTLNMVHQVVSAATSTSPEHEALVYGNVMFTCMSAIPDAILAGSGSGGGAYGRMSMDPRCYTAVTTEVRTQGIAQVWESFMEMPAPSGDQLILFLNMCESWAKYVPLPHEFVRRSVSLIEQSFLEIAYDHPKQQQLAAGMAALRYWIAIMEGGSWTVEQVLSSSLIQRNENSQQPNKKRQTSKSKKRQKEVLEERTTQNQYVLAQNEVHHRAEVACEVTRRTWNSFQPLLKRELLAVTDIDDEIQGDGPVGGVIACANACLPYLVRQPTQSNESLQLFVSIGNAVHEICSSTARSVRGFAAESMYILHEVVIIVGAQKQSFGSDLESIIVDHFFNCCMKLAAQCRYPPAYFKDLTANNDEELEMERNDVRDLLRGVAGSSCSDKSQDSASEIVSSRLLLRLLEACAQPILDASTAESPIFPESALHAYSALARPLLLVAMKHVKSPSNDSEGILNLSLETMSTAGRCIIRGFSMSSPNDLLPLSRLYSLATASLSPMLSTLASTQSYENAVLSVLDVCIRAAVVSLVQLPELTAPSTLRSSRFDIRGAMRSPGGEDHVGVLALMRMATESQALTHMFLNAKASVVVDLSDLYEQLKGIENERGRGVLHGRGVLPKSRRILLGVICHLELSTGGNSGASAMLQKNFLSSVTSVANSTDRLSFGFHADSLFYVCENVYDLAAFSPNMVTTLFDFKVGDSNSPRYACLEVLRYAGIYGFQAISNPSSCNIDSLIQWNRLRGALFMLIKSSGSPDLPMTAVPLVLTVIEMECEAVVLQCNAGPNSSSLIFNDEIISEEAVPAGTLLQALGELLENATASGIPIVSMTNVIHVLFTSRAIVQQAIAAECPTPIEKGSFVDPRPTVAETWLLTINRISAALLQSERTRPTEISNAMNQLLVETCLSIVRLLLYPSLGKTQSQRANDAGMSFDGPQTLAMMEFLHLFFSHGLSLLQIAAVELLKTIPIDPASIQGFSTDPTAAGVAIIGAALFRAAQGGLPPWAIECIPSVYASLFRALNKDPTTFGLVFEMSIHIRLVADRQFGGVQASGLLGGRSFETMGDKAKHKFVTQAMEYAKMDSQSGWRQLKALIKQACGGKKKDTDFKQKPTFTKWDALDRI